MASPKIPTYRYCTSCYAFHERDLYHKDSPRWPADCRARPQSPYRKTLWVEKSCAICSMLLGSKMDLGMSRNALCSCGSGRRLKHCCGTLAEKTPGQRPFSNPTLESLPHTLPGELLQEWLPETWGWPTFLSRIKKAPSRPLGVVHPDGRIARDSRRVTEIVDTRAFQSKLARLVSRFLTDVVEPKLGVKTEWFEEPQLLRYRAGGFYRPHSDRDYWDPRDRRWKQTVDRDISVLIYMDDAFKGGALTFPELDIQINPQPGLAVAFPSDHRFVHAAEPVKAGIRHALVSWAVVAGGPRVNRRATAFIQKPLRPSGREVGPASG